MTAAVIVADVTAVTFRAHGQWDALNAVSITDAHGERLLTVPRIALGHTGGREVLLAAADYACETGVLRSNPHRRGARTVARLWWYVPATGQLKCGASDTNAPVVEFTGGLVLADRGWDWAAWDDQQGTLTCPGGVAHVVDTTTETVHRLLSQVGATT